MSIYAVCFSVIKSCTYWDSSTLQALHEHECLFYEKCNVDRVGKMPSNITVYDAEITIKYSHLNQGSLTPCFYTHDQDKFEIEYFMFTNEQLFLKKFVNVIIRIHTSKKILILL